MNSIQNNMYVNKVYDHSYNNKKTTNVLSAVIGKSDENGKYSLKFEDNSVLTVDKSLITGDIGDTIKVKTETKNSTKTFISQILDQQLIEGELDALKDVTGTAEEDSPYAGFLNDNSIEATAENIKTLQEIKSYINSLISSTGEATVEQLLLMGIDLGGISIDALSKFVYEANTSNLNSVTNSDSFDEFISQNPDFAKDEASLSAARVLFEQGLPVNESNVSRLKEVLEDAQRAAPLTDNELIGFLKQDSGISFENIYKAKYSNFPSVSSKISDSEWNGLKAQVAEIFERDNIEPTQEHFDTARLLIENEIPLNGTNILKADFLKNPSVSGETALKAAAISLSQGKTADKADIFEYGSEGLEAPAELAESYSYTLKYLSRANIYDIQNVIDGNKELNLKNIIDEAAVRSDEYTVSKVSEVSAEAVKAKRQLLEIQMKLTSEAAARLSLKGIDINTRPLSEALSRLKAVESELYAQKLENVGSDVNSRSVDIMTQSVNKVNFLPFFASEGSVYGLVFNNTASPTINEISSAAERIFASFDAFATAPNAKFGDSFSNVKGQFADLLESLDIEASQENIRAAEILSQNNIDITEENILKVKLTDVKINFIYDKLHPMTAANMIKEGINPLETGLDELIDYIKLYSDEYEQTDRDKIAEYIIQADESNSLTSDERAAVASVYRALSFISKKNSKGVGAAVFADSSSTIGDILEISKSIEKARKGIDKSVDDTNEIKLSDSSNGIRASVENAVNADSESLTALKEEYTSILKDRIIELASPEKLVEFISSNGGKADKTTLEQLYYGLESLSKSEENTFISKDKIKALAKDIQQMEKGGADIVEWLNNNHIPLTLNNITNTAKLLNDAFKTGKELNSFKDELEKNNISLEDSFGLSDIYSAAENALSAVEAAEDNAYKLDDLSKINLILKQASAVRNSLSFQQALNNNTDNFYQIPVRLNNNTITSLNMYVLNNESKSDIFKGLLSLETDNLGIVQGYIAVKGKQVCVKITAESSQSESFLSALGSTLYSALEKAGFENPEILFGNEKTLNVFGRENEKTAENNLNAFGNKFFAAV